MDTGNFRPSLESVKSNQNAQKHALVVLEKAGDLPIPIQVTAWAKHNLGDDFTLLVFDGGTVPSVRWVLYFVTGDFTDRQFRVSQIFTGRPKNERPQECIIRP